MVMRNRYARGFSLIELLTVIAVIAILFGLTFFGVSRARESAKRAQCASNVRQIAMALVNSAGDNRGRLPLNNTPGAWSWDTRQDVIERMGKAAELKDIAYCPSGYFPEKDILWDFKDGANGFRAIGYVLLLMGTPCVPAELQNLRVDAHSIAVEGAPPMQIDPARRELVVDATISFGYGNFTEVQGMAPSPHRANHLAGSTPAGGNIGFLDGHVAWRPFAEMKNRAMAPTAWFWW